jgi:hypothetical protein
LLDRVGSGRLAARLPQAGANLVLPKDEAPGLAMGLGGVGVTLQDLALLYSGLPRPGTTKPLREIIGGKRCARAAAVDGSGRGLGRGQCAIGHATAGKCPIIIASRSRLERATAT